MNSLMVLIASAVVAVGLIHVGGTIRWKRGTRKRRAALEATGRPLQPKNFSSQELEGLPAPVQRYFRAVLTDGQQLVRGLSVEHQGRLNLGASRDRWKRFVSSQRVITGRPGFDWDARVSVMPGLTVRVHDSYLAGEGFLRAALFGLFSFVNLGGAGEIAEGELMRFLAEAAWYPTALLPSQGVRWEAEDAHSARATIVDGSTAVTLRFHFDERGLLESARADARGRAVGKSIVPTPWLVRYCDYQAIGGMRVPLEGEVSWLLPEGPRPYWRGRITRIHHEPAGAPV